MDNYRLPGSQQLLLDCDIFEAIFEGTRGPGKTDSLLMDFAQNVGQGYGDAWMGVLFRETYPNLGDVIRKSQRWFPQIFPRARYNAGDHVWIFPDGEKLYFQHARVEKDYWNYHGHEYAWVGWEELTNWGTDELYKAMMSVCRCSQPGVPRRYRATCNPYGVGHNWVKKRFIDPAPRGVIIEDEVGRQRVAELKEWMNGQLDDHLVEPNSGLGEAFRPCLSCKELSFRQRKTLRPHC